jgi:flagellar hook-associated protein 3 FlgL
MIYSRMPNVYRKTTEQALPAVQREVSRLHEQIATGTKIPRASEDPTSFARARSLENREQGFSSILRGLETGYDHLAFTQQQLNALSDLFNDAFAQGTRALNDALSDGDRNQIASSLDTLAATLLDTLNTRQGDTFLFGGALTPAQAPFSIDGVTGELSFSGSPDAPTRALTVDQQLPVGLSGQDLTRMPGGTSIFNALTGMANALRSSDRSGDQAAFGLLENARNHVIDKTAAAGELAKRVELSMTLVREARMTTEVEKSRAADTDIAEAIIKLQQQQTRLQAALKVTADLSQLTLLNYLR